MSKQTTAKSPTLGRPKSAVKRQQILECAGDLLLSLGYNNTSMEAVANKSGVSKQTVYSHFNNKDALFIAVIESKCKMYQVEEASACVTTQPLLDILSSIGLSFISLLNDDEVIAMYKVVISEAKQSSRVGQLFYDAGTLHSINLVSKLLINHPQSQLNAKQAKEASLDFLNLLKSDFHMRGVLQLPYELTPAKQQELALSVANKTMAILPFIKSHT